MKYKTQEKLLYVQFGYGFLLPISKQTKQNLSETKNNYPWVIIKLCSSAT